jgi:hypothetical protein
MFKYVVLLQLLSGVIVVTRIVNKINIKNTKGVALEK